MKRSQLAVAFLPAIFAAGTASAQIAFPGSSPADCEEIGGKFVIPFDKLRDRAIARAGLGLSSSMSKILRERKLGFAASSAINDCSNTTPCTLNIPATDNQPGYRVAISDSDRDGLLKLYLEMDILRHVVSRSADVTAPDGLTLVYRGVPIERPAIPFLNDGLPGLSVQCAKKPSPDGQTETDPDSSDERGPAVILGRSEADSGKTDVTAREFATLGLTIDRDAGKTTGDIDLYASVRLLGQDSALEFSPYVAVQYHSGDDVDDLTLGGELRWQPGSGQHILSGRLAWETDHRFRSSALRADARWRPVAITQWCEKKRLAKGGYVICSAAVVADFQHVYDAGTKAALMTVPEFARIGLDADAAVVLPLAETFGSLRIGGTVAFRQDISGRDADIRLFTGSIGILPADTAHWKFSVDYTNGRDLTSLEKQDIVALSVGFRW